MIIYSKIPIKIVVNIEEAVLAFTAAHVKMVFRFTKKAAKSSKNASKPKREKYKERDLFLQKIEDLLNQGLISDDDRMDFMEPFIFIS